MSRTLVVAASAIETMLAEAAAAHPAECCGLLLGTARRIESAEPTPNAAAEPSRAFEIDPAALVAAHKAARAGGPAVTGYYHSHPTGAAEPSEGDRRASAGDARVWAIVAGGRVTLWRDLPGGFVTLSYTVAGR